MQYAIKAQNTHSNACGSTGLDIRLAIIEAGMVCYHRIYIRFDRTRRWCPLQCDNHALHESSAL
jgi:hypothetical protein